MAREVFAYVLIPYREPIVGLMGLEIFSHIDILDFEEAVNVVDNYIHFYNYDRIQLEIKLTPFKLRCQFV